jgi:hypothetical protein
VPELEDNIEKRILEWGDGLEKFSLPGWDDIPDFGLYMEQVIAVMTKYLEFFSDPDAGTQPVTAAAVNNYVRAKLMPKPEGKKYYRRHIVYLIMICVLKQNMSMSSIERLLPGEYSEEELKEQYSEFTELFSTAREYFVEHIKQSVSDRRAAGGRLTGVRYVKIMSILGGMSGRMVSWLMGGADVAKADSED